MLIENRFVDLYENGVAIYGQLPVRRMVSFHMNGYKDDYTYDDNEYDDNEYDDEYDDDEVLNINPNFKYEGNYYLSIPHTLYRLTYIVRNNKFVGCGLSVVFTNNLNVNNLKTEDELIFYAPPLSNIFEDLDVCVDLTNQKFETIEELFKNAIAKFWATTFDDSSFQLKYSYYSFKNLLSDARKWEKKTKKSPLWVPDGKNLKRIQRLTYKDFCDFPRPLTQKEIEYTLRRKLQGW